MAARGCPNKNDTVSKFPFHPTLARVRVSKLPSAQTTFAILLGILWETKRLLVDSGMGTFGTRVSCAAMGASRYTAKCAASSRDRSQTKRQRRRMSWIGDSDRKIERHLPSSLLLMATPTYSNPPTLEECRCSWIRKRSRSSPSCRSIKHSGSMMGKVCL